MDRLSGLDASFLYLESSTNLLNVCGLLIVDQSTMPVVYDFETLRDALRERIGSNPAFRRKLHNPILNLDHPVWVDDDEFDIERHVRRLAVAAPGNRDQLAAACGDIAGHALDRSKPLWEMWIIEGLEDGSIAVFTKMHHAAVDGVSGASLVSELCSLKPDAEPLATDSAQHSASRRPSDLAIVADGALRLARRPAKLMKLLPNTLGVVPAWIQRSRSGTAMAAPFTAPRTSFNGTITSHRSIAFAQVSLDDVKEVKNAFDCTVNDVVLTMCAGALRKYLADRDELPDTSLVATVPVSVHGKSEAPGANKVSALFSSLASDVADPVERLRKIGEQNISAKEHHQTLSASLLQDWAQFAAPNTFALAVRMYSALRLANRHPVIHNLVISNVPGPPKPIYFMGAKITGFYPFGPVFDGAGLNITVMSNAGKLNIGAIACRELAPHLWELADDMSIALDELLEAARATRPKRSGSKPKSTQPASPA